MKSLRLLNTLILILLLTGLSFSQTNDPRPVFEEESHDFGKLEEVKGKVEHKFVFSNMGAQALVITNVNSSCGCTAPSWSKEPIPPGGKGFITAVFEPAGIKGVFHKSITVNFTDLSPVVLSIKGEVIPKPMGIEDEYRFALGPIRMKQNNVHFQDIFSDETKSQSVQIINTGTESVKVTFNEKRAMPPYITIVCNPQTLQPGEKGVITFTYDAKAKNDYAYVYDRIYFNFNGSNDNNHKINVSAYIKERFTPEMLKNPPVFSIIGDKTYDFGKVRQGDKIEYTFKFKNTGKSDLIIRKTKASCGCTAVNVGNEVIKPGEEGNIKIIFDTHGKSGNQNKSVTVTTNIPDVEGQEKRSEIILLIKGMVEVPTNNPN
jgi:hypothetical protein